MAKWGLGDDSKEARLGWQGFSHESLTSGQVALEQGT